ncbi:MAG TPA: DUF423 domain-containing protein [Polyangiaceae bacterium]|nr:DUF423 domain-containing protein [Polyangiaceae bacterium]
MEAVVVLAACAGFSGVALGAFGAHGLRARLADSGDAARRLEWWQTGASYHLAHALAIGVTAALDSAGQGCWTRCAAWAFAAGIVLFSGSLYVMGATGRRRLGAITPLGGLAFLAGWAFLLVAGLDV